MLKGLQIEKKNIFFIFFQIPWQIEQATEHILDIIAKNVPVMSPKENAYNFSIHIDLYNKDLQN